MATAQTDTPQAEDNVEVGYYDPDEEITYTVDESGDEKDSAGSDKGQSDEQPSEGEDSGLSPDLRDEAEHVYGLPAETIAKFQTDEELQRFLDAAAQLPGRSPQPAWQPQQQEPPQQREDVRRDTPEDLNIDLSGMEADDPNRKAIETLVAERNALKRDVSEIRSYIQQHQQAETRRLTDHLVNELYAGLSELDPVLYGKPDQRKAGQEALVQEVMSEYHNIISGQMQAGRDPYSLDLRAIAKRAGQGMHFPKLVRRHQQRESANGRQRTERGTFARQTNTPGPPEPAEHSKIGNLTENRELLGKVSAIRNRPEQ